MKPETAAAHGGPLPGGPLPGGPLLSRLGHEMRGPLAGIQGLTSVMRTTLSAGLGNHDRLDRQLTLIGSSAADLLRTVDQVVDLVRLDADPVPPAAALDCAAVVAEVVARREPGGRHLVVDLPGHPLPAVGDAGHLRRILTELIDNATRYADPGDIRIALRAEAGHPVITVSDPGPPIPAADRALLFAPFTRGSTAERCDHAGSGLGLCIAHRLADRIGAELRLAGGTPGTTFAIRLRPAGG
jgi:signal transduction histidine kinase